MALVAKIITELDARGIIKAEGAFMKFTRTAAIAGAAAAALGAVIAKTSKAAMEDQQAMLRLDRTLANMGWASSVTQVENYIASLEAATGVLDDELRPAFQRMFTILGDANAAQGLMSTAMDIAAGTGLDLATVTQKLTAAINGQRRGLLTLGLGIDAQTAKTISMSEVLTIAEQRFGGMSAAMAQTPLGKLQRVNAAFENLKETIGYSFINGIEEAGVKTDKLITQTNKWAETLGTLFSGAAWLVSRFTDGLDWVAEKIGRITGAAFEATVALNDMTRFTFTKDQVDALMAKVALEKRLAEIKRKQEEAAARAAAEKAKAEAKAAAAAAKALRAKMLAAKYDLQLINIAAAKKRTGSTDTMSRLNDLQQIALDSMDLTAGQAGVSTSTVVNNNFVTTVQGSVVTQQELTSILAQELALAQQRNGYGKWGGGL